MPLCNICQPKFFLFNPQWFQRWLSAGVIIMIKKKKGKKNSTFPLTPNNCSDFLVTLNANNFNRKRSYLFICLFTVCRSLESFFLFLPEWIVFFFFFSYLYKEYSSPNLLVVWIKSCHSQRFLGRLWKLIHFWHRDPECTVNKTD